MFTSISVRYEYIMKIRLMIWVVFLWMVNPALAVTNIEVKALMPGMAVLLLDVNTEQFVSAKAHPKVSN